jgi:hypothetical protein
MLRAVEQLLRDEGFRVALLVALAGTCAVVYVHRRGWWISVEAGVVAVVAALVSLAVTDRRSMLSLAGVVLVALGAELGCRFPGWWTPLGCVPGAALLGLGLDAPVPDWARWACLVAAAIAPVLVVATDRGTPRLLPVLLVMTAVGMWATTPDTEHTRVLVGALGGAAVLALDRRLRAGAAGTAAITSLLVWAAVLDGYPRRGAVVGALACFGAAGLLPLVGRSRVGWQLVPVAGVLAVQVALVIVSARVAGLRTDARTALLISALAWFVAALGLRLATRARPT